MIRGIGARGAVRCRSLLIYSFPIRDIFLAHLDVLLFNSLSTPASYLRRRRRRRISAASGSERCSRKRLALEDTLATARGTDPFRPVRYCAICARQSSRGRHPPGG